MKETIPPPGARGPRLADTPTISVVVASRAERGLLEACLASLLPQCAEHGAEIVVARAGLDRALQAAFAGVTFIDAPAGAPLPALRAAGIAVADGDIVAVTEDHCTVAPDWLTQLVAGQRAGADVVGGTMEKAGDQRAVDWAAYFAEYGTYLSAASTGGVQQLTAANVAYRRSVIEEVVAAAREGHWEKVAHDRLAAQGRTVAFLGTAAVYENRRHRLLDFCRDRFAHGRDYAKVRLAEEGAARRWLYFAGSPALPLLLAGRIARAAGRRRLGPFLRALPFTVLFLAAWSAGEAAGYWRGPRRGAGESVGPKAAGSNAAPGGARASGRG